MKKRFIIGIVVLAVVTMISGISILAFATPGTQEDPFITLSYLTSVFRPRVMADVSTLEQELTEKFETPIAELEQQIQASLSGSAPAAPSQADRFTVVTLRMNQSLTCSVGTEIMLRIGTATGVGSAPALVTYTTGETLAAGSSLVANYMYLVTIEGNGIRASSDNVRVVVRGDYTITG